MLNKDYAKRQLIPRTTKTTKHNEKYESKNPISQYLINGFFSHMSGLLDSISFDTIYEAGCGDGYVTRFLHQRYSKCKITASDISGEELKAAQSMAEGEVTFFQRSIYELRERDSAYDLVVASEVLEHLEEPQKALEELSRITNQYVLVSVPREPIWRVCNMARGKYLRDFGNTPTHIQHWSKRKFILLLSRYFDIIAIASPFPWTMVLCKKK